MAHKLIQIIYDESQRSFVYPFAEVYFSNSLTVFFENKIIADLVLAARCDKISICSWKLKSKLRYYIGRPREITPELLESDYEVMSFTRNTKDHRMFQAAEAWHPGFMATFDKILGAIGVKRPGEIKNPIYQNHFSARTSIYKDYVNTYLIPAMEAITNDTEINALAMQNSKYSDLTNQKAENLKEKIGISYYPMIPFLLERLFSVYCQNKGIKISHL